jgi:hypothetical protein
MSHACMAQYYNINYENNMLQASWVYTGRTLSDVAIMVNNWRVPYTDKPFRKQARDYQLTDNDSASSSWLLCMQNTTRDT